MRKIYLLLTLLLCTIVRSGFACDGGYFNPAEKYDKLFNQYIYPDKIFHMFLYCPERVFDLCECAEEVQEANLMDWIKYLDNKPTLQDAKTLFYYTSKEDLLQLQDMLNGIKSYQLSNPALLKNSFFEYIKNNKRTDVMQYIIYAKEQEMQKNPEEVFYSWYQGESSSDESGYNSNNLCTNNPALLEEGIKLYNSEKDAYLKARYAYQLVREGYLTYNELEKEFGSWEAEKSYILLRAWERMAGFLLEQGDWLRSQLIFLRVFEMLPDRRNICINSMRLNNDERFNTLYKATNYSPILSFVKSYKYDQPEEAAIEDMLTHHYQDSPYIDVLMLRKISLLQTWKYENSFSDDSEDVNSRFSQNELQQFLQVVERVLAVKKKEKDLWQMAKAYTLIMLGENVAAHNLLATISVKKEYRNQLANLKVLASVEMEKQELDPQKIEALFKKYLALNDSDSSLQLRNYMFHAFAKYYEANNNKLFALLCDDKVSLYGNSRYDLIDLDFINQLEALYKKKDKTPLEKELIGLAGLPKDVENYFNEMRGTYYLQHCDARKAYAELKKIPDDFKLKYYSSSRVNFGFYSNWDGSELYDVSIFSFANRHYFDSPFDERCDNIHSRFKFLSKKDALQNKKDLARLIVELEDKAAKNDKDAVYYNYMLGNVWYNMSPLGWFRRVLQFEPINEGERMTRRFEYKYDPTVAENYYLKAQQLATDNELKAKIAFCLASLYNGTEKRNTYYDMLANKYEKSEYYKEIIKECGYFKHFVKR